METEEKVFDDLYKIYQDLTTDISELRNSIKNTNQTITGEELTNNMFKLISEVFKFLQIIILLIEFLNRKNDTESYSEFIQITVELSRYLEELKRKLIDLFETMINPEFNIDTFIEDFEHSTHAEFRNIFSLSEGVKDKMLSLKNIFDEGFLQNVLLINNAENNAENSDFIIVNEMYQNALKNLEDKPLQVMTPISKSYTSSSRLGFSTDDLFSRKSPKKVGYEEINVNLHEIDEEFSEEEENGEKLETRAIAYIRAKARNTFINKEAAIFHTEELFECIARLDGYLKTSSFDFHIDSKKKTPSSEADNRFTKVTVRQNLTGLIIFLVSELKHDFGELIKSSELFKLADNIIKIKASQHIEEIIKKIKSSSIKQSGKEYLLQVLRELKVCIDKIFKIPLNSENASASIITLVNRYGIPSTSTSSSELSAGYISPNGDYNYDGIMPEEVVRFVNRICFDVNSHGQINFSAQNPGQIGVVFEPLMTLDAGNAGEYGMRPVNPVQQLIKDVFYKKGQKDKEDTTKPNPALIEFITFGEVTTDITIRYDNDKKQFKFEFKKELVQAYTKLTRDLSFSEILLKNVSKTAIHDLLKKLFLDKDIVMKHINKAVSDYGNGKTVDMSIPYLFIDVFSLKSLGDLIPYNVSLIENTLMISEDDVIGCVSSRDYSATQLTMVDVTFEDSILQKLFYEKKYVIDAHIGHAGAYFAFGNKETLVLQFLFTLKYSDEIQENELFKIYDDLKDFRFLEYLDETKLYNELFRLYNLLNKKGYGLRPIEFTRGDSNETKTEKIYDTFLDRALTSAENKGKLCYATFNHATGLYEKIRNTKISIKRFLLSSNNVQTLQTIIYRTIYSNTYYTEASVVSLFEKGSYIFSNYVIGLLDSNSLKTFKYLDYYRNKLRDISIYEDFIQSRKDILELDQEKEFNDLTINEFERNLTFKNAAEVASSLYEIELETLLEKGHQIDKLGRTMLYHNILAEQLVSSGISIPSSSALSSSRTLGTQQHATLNISQGLLPVLNTRTQPFPLLSISGVPLTTSSSSQQGQLELNTEGQIRSSRSQGASSSLSTSRTSTPDMSPLKRLKKDGSSGGSGKKTRRIKKPITKNSNKSRRIKEAEIKKSNKSKTLRKFSKKIPSITRKTR